MTKLTIIAFLFSIAFYSNPSFSLELTVNLAKVKTFDKKIMMELFLFTEEETQRWNKLLLIEKRVVELSFESQVVIFPTLQAGTYAMRVFQDSNNNSILDRSTSDIPLEPVGFSQNPSLFSGEPTPEDSALVLMNDQSITINLKHRKPRKKRKSFQ